MKSPTVTDASAAPGHFNVNFVVDPTIGVSRLPLEATAPMSATFGLLSVMVQPFIFVLQDHSKNVELLGNLTEVGFAPIVHVGVGAGAGAGAEAG